MRVPDSNKTMEGVQDAKQWLSKHPDVPSRLRNILCQYYAENGRDLPWRRTRDPYEVLVAEILLQKTAYKPVTRVWPKLVECYPDINALAKASVEELEALIYPLGLHKRAKRLVHIAEAIVEKTGGEIPTDRVFLKALPGVGDYTTAAVLSYALGVKAAAIDVNGARVLTRVAGFEPSTHRQALAFAHAVGDRLITQDKHRGVNYALLDLSADICRPKPHCEVCPAAFLCQFVQQGGG